MQGTLRYQVQQGSSRHEISQRRISSMLRNVAPCAHNERVHDLLDRTNPVPYYAPYFGYKLHMAAVGWSLDLLQYLKRTLGLSTNIYFGKCSF